MADSPKTKGKGPSKKIGPLPTWGWVAGGVATFGVYYIYKKHAANVAASTPATGIDPNTGVPYSQETGTYAPTGGSAVDPNTGVPYSQETGSNAIDPLTGQTYASELSGLTGTGSTAGLIDPTTGIPFSVELQNAIAGIPGAGTTGSTTGTTTGTTDTTTGATTGTTDTTTGATTGTTTTPTTSTGLTPLGFAQGLAAQLTAAYGPGTNKNLSTATITDQLNAYLNGQAVTNSVIAQGINNITSAGNSLGSQAINTGGLIKPVITSAATVTTTHTPSEVVTATPVITNAPVATATTTPAKSTVVPAPTGGSAGGLGVIAPGKPLTNTATAAQSAAFVKATTNPSTTQADRLANTPNPTGITGTLITGPLQAAPQTAANLLNTFVVGPAAAAGNIINTILGF